VYKFSQLDGCNKYWEYEKRQWSSERLGGYGVTTGSSHSLEGAETYFRTWYTRSGNTKNGRDVTPRETSRRGVTWNSPDRCSSLSYPDLLSSHTVKFWDPASTRARLRLDSVPGCYVCLHTPNRRLLEVVGGILDRQSLLIDGHRRSRVCAGYVLIEDGGGMKRARSIWS
jgi:hypothetical protein